MCEAWGHQYQATSAWFKAICATAQLQRDSDWRCLSCQHVGFAFRRAMKFRSVWSRSSCESLLTLTNSVRSTMQAHTHRSTHTHSHTHTHTPSLTDTCMPWQNVLHTCGRKLLPAGSCSCDSGLLLLLLILLLFLLPAPCSLLLASLLINKALYSCPERLRQTGRQKGAYTWKNNTKIISWPYKKSHICIFCKYSPYHLKNIWA